MSQNLATKRHRPFILIAVLLSAVTFLDRLIPEGMFSDGVVYATLSRNIAIGHGTMWNPYFGHASGFVDHPTLMFGIEALFFKVLGDHYTTEKIFAFVVWLITILLITRIWSKANTDPNYKGSYWLPLLLWCLAPSVLWSYPNNMLDTAMCIFDMAAVLLLYRAGDSVRFGLPYLLLASLSIFCASLIKGPVGLFPLAVPFIHWLVLRKSSFGKAVLSSIVITAFVICFYFILVQFPAPKAYLATYLDAQVFGAIRGTREKVDSSLGHFTLLKFLLVELLPAIGFALLIFAATKILKLKPIIKPESKKAIFFMLVGLSASLPIMVSIKQRSFYTIPALPYLVIAVSLSIYPYLYTLVTRHTLSSKWSRIFSIAFTLAVVGCGFYLGKGIGTVSRDHDILHDTKLLKTIVTPQDTFGVCNAMLYDFEFRAYTARFLQMESKPRKDFRHVLVNNQLCGKEYTDSLEQMGFKRLDLGTWRYIVYERATK